MAYFVSVDDELMPRRGFRELVKARECAKLYSKEKPNRKVLLTTSYEIFFNEQ